MLRLRGSGADDACVDGLLWRAAGAGGADAAVSRAGAPGGASAGRFGGGPDEQFLSAAVLLLILITPLGSGWEGVQSPKKINLAEIPVLARLGYIQ